MLVQQWLTSLQNQLRSRFARSPRGRRQQNRRLKTPSAQALVSRNVIETLEDRTLLTAFTVVNTDDSGEGSLRAAIEAANANAGADTISFDAALSEETIVLNDELLISDDLTITGLGANQLTLDGNNNSRIFNIDDDSDASTILVEISGLTLTNGNSNTVDTELADNGGAIFSTENLLVENCVFIGNTAGSGGAIYDDASSLTVRGSQFIGNTAEESDGGAIYHSETFPYPEDGERLLIENSQFAGNHARFSGGAVLLRDGISIVTGSTFTENTAEFPGGAIANIFGDLTVNDSSFIENHTDFSGGAIDNNGTLFVSGSTFDRNTADVNGGGIYSQGAESVTIYNSTFSGNSSVSNGGGIFALGSKPVSIINSTIVGNVAAGSGISNGGGIYLFSTDPTLILNTIIAGNQADSGQQIAGDFTGTANIIQESIAGLLDPELKDNGGPTKTHALLSDSAAINAGDNIAATNAGLTTDQRGTGFSRIVSDIIDIGAFESSVVEPVDLVVSTTSDVVDGNYSPGLLSLREAIQLANSTSGADTISFDASLAGQTIVLTSELLISDHLTITGLGADQLTISGDNDSRIFNIFDGQVDTLIDVEISGLTLTRGSSTQGGAIYNYENIVLTDTLFTENKASSEGAAIFSGQGSVSMSESRLSANIADRGAGIFAINSILTLDTSTFSGNTVTRDGSAIYNIFYTPSLELNPSTITGCTFVDNTAAGNGGGIYNSGGIIIVSDSTFSEQKAVLGGGIYSKTNGYTGNISVINSTFSNNTEVESGGGIYSDGVGLSVEDSFFTGNVVFGENTNGLGGGIYITGGSLTVTGTEFSDNVASRGGGGIYSGGNEFLTISASTFNRNQSRSGGGIFNNNTTLSILDSRFTENQALVTPGKEYLSAVGGAVFNSYAVATAAGEMDTLIANTEFTGNYADNAGAAIQQSFGFITINNSLITENLVGTSGSGIHNSFGQMTVHQSTISNNKSLGNGSGISNNGTLLLSESTVAGNIATYFGGGVYISSDGTTTISNSTLSGNQSARDGGALYANTNQPLSIINTTITGNSAVRGGGIRADNVIPALTNSIIAGNTADLEPQLYSNYTNVNSIVQDSIVGLLDPVLRDNGGPTKTHALLPGSAAIDAGDNTAATAAGLTTDQRGESSSRIVDGTVDIGAFEVQAPFAQVDLRIVSSETTTEDNGEVSALPANREWINEWGGYWLEIWISSPLATSQGIASVNLNLSYNTVVTTAVAIEYGAAFTIGQTGTINDHTGVIENLSAVTSLSDVGDDQPVLFARIRFESESADAVALDVEGQTLNPQSPSILVDSSEILFAGSAASEEVNGPAPETTIYANPFDLNDDELINYRDLMLFIRAFGTTPGQSSNHFAWAADYNQNGRVDFPDLLAMVFNFGKSKEGAIPIDYPANFPEAWNQLLTVETQQPLQTTAKSVTQAAAETMLESAKAELSPQLDSEQRQVLSEVDIEVVDLAAGTLGRAVPGTIYIDVNAAGYGWYVDATPADNSEFSFASELSLIALPDSEAAGHVDLWTVILHELGHLLGYEHADDGVMQESLTPGERRLADWQSETDAFFGTLTDDAELSVF